MSIATLSENGDRILLMGNEAIARGALEAGVNVVSGYPGTPSSESVDHLAQCGTRGAMVLISCEDPGALSSTNEGDSRPYAQMMGFPLLEPGSIQEAREMTHWAFELSDRIRSVAMLRSVTRISHASGDVTVGVLPSTEVKASFEFNGPFNDQQTGPAITFPSLVEPQRLLQKTKLEKAAKLFETSPFNTYTGPDLPELLIITSSVCALYCTEAIEMLAVSSRVGVLKLGTTWPLPAGFIQGVITSRMPVHPRILVVEERISFLEGNLKVLSAESSMANERPVFYGKNTGQVPPVNELNPDRVARSLADVLGLPPQPGITLYKERAQKLAATNAPARALTFCPGCPHRASFWLIDQALKKDHRQGFVCGDIGCYTLAATDCGFYTLKTSYAMGSGAGLAAGSGKLGQFGFSQPVMAVCGDSCYLFGHGRTGDD
jgi:indolepyruvate ferredoxin oxidoreductase alpha subunit